MLSKPRFARENGKEVVGWVGNWYMINLCNAERKTCREGAALLPLFSLSLMPY